MLRRFAPDIGYRALLAADAAVFAAFYLLPQFEVVESAAAASALELEGYGALIALSHPLSIAVHVAIRSVFVVLLFLGYGRLGRYALVAAMLLAVLSAAIGGLAVFTALDMLALTILYFLDGYLLCRTTLVVNLKSSGSSAVSSESLGGA